MLYSPITSNHKRMNLSFAGCGFMGLYHVGVVACLRKYAPDLCLKKVSGASAGAMAAACLLCDAPLGNCSCFILSRCSVVAWSSFPGVFNDQGPFRRRWSPSCVGSKSSMLLLIEDYLSCLGRLEPLIFPCLSKEGPVRSNEVV